MRLAIKIRDLQKGDKHSHGTVMYCGYCFKPNCMRVLFEKPDGNHKVIYMNMNREVEVERDK